VASAVGDVDQDGYGDLFVAGGGGLRYFVSGRDGSILYPAGVPATQPSIMSTNPRVASANGDLDGDGIDDFYVYDPNAMGPQGLTGSGTVIAHSGATGTPVWQVTGGILDELGGGFAPAGDIDQDGRVDVIVGAPQGPNPMATGYVFVLSGATGAAIQMLTPPPNSTATAFGGGVSGGGDLDGDQMPDVVVQDGWYPTTTRAYSGATWQILQAWSGSGGIVGDVNGDGLDDMGVVQLVGTTLTLVIYSGASTQVLMTLNDPENPAGALSLLSFSAQLGDTNGDGRADLLCFASASTSLVISGADGQVLGTLPLQPSVGSSAWGVGDLNGDGLADVAQYTNPTVWNPAQVDVYSFAPLAYATVRSLGAGCGLVPGLTLSVSGAPQLGSTPVLQLAGAPSGASGQVYAGSVLLPPVQLASGCQVFLDPATAVPALPFLAGGGGTWSQAFSLPWVAPLAGTRIGLQALLVGGASPSVSNALEVVLGY
jgi:hypothetical protein